MIGVIGVIGVIRVPAVFDLSVTPALVRQQDRNSQNTDDTDLRNQHGQAKR